MKTMYVGVIFVLAFTFSNALAFHQNFSKFQYNYKEYTDLKFVGSKTQKLPRFRRNAQFLLFVPPMIKRTSQESSQIGSVSSPRVKQVLKPMGKQTTILITCARI